MQLGGPSGGCIPVQYLNASVDYETIVELGAIVGSGGMIVMDEDTCVVDVARFFMEFCKEESCGKCTPCRVGTAKMLEILNGICEGRGKEGDIETLERWARIIQNTALCGLGQTAPNPVLSTLRYFRDEYEAHIFEKRCPAAVCSDLFKTPCMHACPIEMDIPAYLALIKARRLDDAYKVLLKTNPFPSICGRVCDHKCEAKCRRATLDEPVSIKQLKRFITDHGTRPPVEKVSVTHPEQIGVIGAGPSGLTAARDLAMMGYAVTVFDRFPEPGGMLRWGIPAYRLPREILKKEIDDILGLGVELRCNTLIGRDVSWAEIRSAFQAVYLAIGAQRSNGNGFEGEKLRGVLGAIEFLRDLNMGKPPRLGKRVSVIGGGNSAIDAARSALRLGAGEVTILYRRRKQDMPAQQEEIRAAEEEGVRIIPLVAPIKMEGEKGCLEKVFCQRMSLGDFDGSGRKRPVPRLGDELVLKVDSAILAIGQDVEYPVDMESKGLRLTRKGLIEVEKGKKTETSASMVFAGGDVVSGPDTVVGAIAYGHHAAKEMDTALREKNGEPPFIARDEVMEIPMILEEDVKERPRACPPEADCAERIKDFREVELGFSVKEAMDEASRCLRCDVKAE